MSFLQELEIILNEYTDTQRKLWGKKLDDFFNKFNTLVEIKIDSNLDSITKEDLEKYIRLLNEFVIIYQLNYIRASQIINYVESADKKQFLSEVQALHIALCDKLEIFQPKKNTPVTQTEESIPTAYLSWIDSTQEYTPPVPKSKKSVTLRVFTNGSSNTIMGINSNGHISLEVFDPENSPTTEYFSFGFEIGARDELSDSMAERAGYPKRGAVNGRLRSFQEDTHKYKECYEISIDCSYNDPPLDVEKIFKKISEIQKNIPQYDFYKYNCSSAFVDIVKDAINEGGLHLPFFTTPFSLHHSFAELASHQEKNKFNNSQVVKETTWSDLFEYFSRQLCLADPSLIALYLQIKDKTIKLPKSEYWFDFGNDNLETFIRHLLIISQGLAQEKNISDEQAYAFIEKTKELLLPFTNDSTVDFIDFIIESLYPLTRKISEENFLDILRVHHGNNTRKILAQEDESKPESNEIFQVITVANIGTDLHGNLKTQILNTRNAIQELYRLEDKHNGKVFSKEFYTRNRNNLRQYLGHLYNKEYFEVNLVNEFNHVLQVTTQPNSRIDETFEIAINDLNKGSIKPLPALWKFWRWNERNQVILDNSSTKVAQILNHARFSPYQKQKIISEIIDENAPNPLAFWRTNHKKEYHALAQKSELILIAKSFLEGYVQEEDFYLNLEMHAKKYPDSNAHDIAQQFKNKYKANLKKNIDDDDQALTKLTSTESRLVKKMETAGVKHLCVPAFQALQKVNNLSKSQEPNVEALLAAKLEASSRNHTLRIRL